MDKKKALTELIRSKFVNDRVVARQEASRLAKLRKFLNEHQYASQWAVCCAALEDAVLHNVTPTDAMICDAITRCGRRGRLAKAKDLYTNFYRRIGRPRSLAAHTAFLGACAAVGDFAEAHNQFRRLYERDRALFAKDAAHCPAVTDDLTTEYLRAALAASTLKKSPLSPPLSTPSISSAASDASRTVDRAMPLASLIEKAPWRVALENLVELRKDPCFRQHNELTPLLVEAATQLTDVGGQWELCLQILKGAARDQSLIPPEAYDAAIRVCYRHQRHLEVVDLMCSLIATQTAPDERSVRLTLVSAEEVAALERAAGLQRATSWALSLTLFEAIRLNGMPLYQQSYESPLRTCALAGKWERALGMLEVMRQDCRPISTELYCVAMAARIEACTSYAEAERFLRLPGLHDGAPSAVLYLAAMRCCLKLKDWKHAERLSKEMKNRDMPESYDKIKLLIEIAYAQGKHHAVLARFARLENITNYERERVVRDQMVRLHEEDFAVPERILDMVLDSYEKVKDQTKDAMVEAAYRGAIRRKQRGVLKLNYSFLRDSQVPRWMFSQKARDERSPSPYH